jgi:hypothetical protein
MPNLPQAWFLLSQAEFASGNYRQAVASIQTGMKLDKSWPTLPFEPRKEVYKGREADYDEHFNRLANAAGINQAQPILLFLVGHQLWFDGQRQDAMAIFQRARPLDNNVTFIDIFLAAGGRGAIAVD